MNHRPLNSLLLGKAITGFVNYETAEELSDHSVDSYKRILEQVAAMNVYGDVCWITRKFRNSKSK